MRKRFCPKCGIEIEKGVFCSKCSLQKSDAKFSAVDILVCASCNSFFHKNKWKKSDDLKKTVELVVRNKIKKMAIDTISVSFPEFKKNPGYGFDFEVLINNEYLVPGRINFTLCNICGKNHTKYFEGVLQLRNADNEIINYVLDDINKKKGILITGEKDFKNGKDFQVSNKKYLRTIAKKLHYTFGGRVKESEQLFTKDWKTSRDVYRLNVLVEFPKTRKGEVIVYNNRLYYIITTKKRIVLEDIVNRRRTSIELKKEKNTKKLNTIDTSVSKVTPKLEILDPETFESVPVVNQPNLKLREGEKIRVVNYNGKFYFVKKN